MPDYNTMTNIQDLIGQSLPDYSLITKFYDNLPNTIPDYNTTINIQDLIGQSLPDYSLITKFYDNLPNTIPDYNTMTNIQDLIGQSLPDYSLITKFYDNLPNTIPDYNTMTNIQDLIGQSLPDLVSQLAVTPSLVDLAGSALAGMKTVGLEDEWSSLFANLSISFPERGPAILSEEPENLSETVDSQSFDIELEDQPELQELIGSNRDYFSARVYLACLVLCSIPIMLDLSTRILERLVEGSLIYLNLIGQIPKISSEVNGLLILCTVAPLLYAILTKSDRKEDTDE